MLRQRLLLLFGCIVTLVLVMGVGVVVLLQSVVGQLNAVSSDAMTGVSAVRGMQVSVASFRTELDRITEAQLPFDPVRWDHDLGAIEANVAELRGVRDVSGEADAARAELPPLVDHLSTLREGLIGESEPVRRESHDRALADLESIRDALDIVHNALRSHAATKMTSAIDSLQSIALWLGIGFVVVLNVSVIFLSGIGGMILKPIDRLVDASRRLAREEFDHRVEIQGPSEFAELARAYNSLAEQLAANEQRKIETLQHVARTLNHELNNAITIIQLQLSLAARSAARGVGGSAPLDASRLREIQQALSRMTGTVSALTRVRRIVLTDYLSGVKMLDLEASLEASPSEPERSRSATAAGQTMPT